MQQQLVIILARASDFVGESLYLELVGVRNLRIEQPKLSLIGLPNVEIYKAPNTGKYDRRFVVLDAEQDEVFRCSCHDFIASIK
jgi:hypothetical protein